MKRKRIGSWFVFGGLLLLAAALCLTVYNLNEQTRAARAAADTLQQLEALAEHDRAPETDSAPAGVPDAGEDAVIPEYLRDPVLPMPEIWIDGEAYVGIVSIPALELRLPVISQWSYPRLRLAPCRYLGSAYTNDLVVMAHNYAGHFGRLAGLQPGDEVYVEDMSGNVFRYTVAALEMLDGTALEEMTAGGWALTLFTCNLSGQSRITVRCELADD